MSAEAQCRSISNYCEYGGFEDLGSTEWSSSPWINSPCLMTEAPQDLVDPLAQDYTYTYQLQPNNDNLLASLGAGFDSPSSWDGCSPHPDNLHLRQEWEPGSTPLTAPRVSPRPSQKGPYPCICLEQFKTLEALEKHAKSEAHRVYCCPVLGCSKTFYRRDSYARHKTQHTASETHVCSRCFKSFKRKDHLDQHVKKLHSPEYARQPPRILHNGSDAPDSRRQAVKDLKRACCTMYPDDAEALQRLQKFLKITDDSTSDEVAQNVVEIVLGLRKSP